MMNILDAFATWGIGFIIPFMGTVFFILKRESKKAQ